MDRTGECRGTLPRLVAPPSTQRAHHCASVCPSAFSLSLSLFSRPPIDPLPASFTLERSNTGVDINSHFFSRNQPSAPHLDPSPRVAMSGDQTAAALARLQIQDEKLKQNLHSQWKTGTRDCCRRATAVATAAARIVQPSGAATARRLRLPRLIPFPDPSVLAMPRLQNCTCLTSTHSCRGSTSPRRT